MSRLPGPLGRIQDRGDALVEKMAENHVPELLILVASVSALGMGAAIGLDPNVTGSRSFGATFRLFPPTAWGWALSVVGVWLGVGGWYRRRKAVKPAWVAAALFGLIAITTILSVPMGGLPLAVVIFTSLSWVCAVTAIAATGRRGRPA